MHVHRSGFPRGEIGFLPLYYIQQVNGDRCSGMLQRLKFRNSLIS
jgi:hypothetical protein